MNKQSGKYLTQKIGGEEYKAYIPFKLPPGGGIDLQKLHPYLEKATCAIAELNGAAKFLPNHSLFIYMYVRREALLSSQIEGTQSSFSDLMLFENDQKPNISLDDVEEVSNYVKAINYGLERIKNGFPLSLRLLREIHEILLSGIRGSLKSPGEFRRSQNWIGGTRPGNAFFVPAPPEQMMDCLYDLEKFLHDDSVPTLIKAGLAHVQFETIHPFLDGNGRLGRLLIILLLHAEGMIESPILYLSMYLKQNRETYYSLLQEVRTRGAWEAWLEFFLQGVIAASKDGIQTAQEINALFKADFAKIESLGQIKFSCKRVLEHLKHLPQISVRHLSQTLAITPPTARNCLNKMVSLGILEETTGKKRDKIYVYCKYLTLLEGEV
ncbi:MAG: cell filamentation protein Fic [Rickettsiales bacterium]|nr:MAG: cell filamentation protein Fic [Rickettsiales bacterium]